MDSAGNSPPPGIKALRAVGLHFNFVSFQILVWALTFLSYTLYHASRKPLSIVKGVLRPVPTPSNSTTLPPVSKNGWPPFDGPYGRSLMGELDLAFLACYSFGMYYAGHLADSFNLRVFLSIGMLGSGLFVCLFGVGYFLNIHSLAFFFFAHMGAGLFQSTGWPSVVAAMANWYGRGGRGLIMGIWNAHTSVGNILGSLVSSAVLTMGWGWAFIFPGLGIAFGGVLTLLFLPGEPSDVGLSSIHNGEAAVTSGEETKTDYKVEAEEAGTLEAALISPLAPGSELEAAVTAPSAHLTDSLKLEGQGQQLGAELRSAEGKEAAAVQVDAAAERECAALLGESSEVRAEAVGFFEAWRIPGVAAFAFCLFFAKLVAYTFLDWLPFYISHTQIDGVYVSDALAGLTSIVYDLGGIAGGILAGYLSDMLQTPALVSATFMLGAVPALALYYSLGHLSLLMNVILLALVGFCVNGPYALITCAVSADLGQHESLRGNRKALATVTGIIDGTGSVGAGVGPFFTGILADVLGGWAGVFGMLMSAAALAVICILRLIRAELAFLWEASRQRGAGGATSGGEDQFSPQPQPMEASAD